MGYIKDEQQGKQGMPKFLLGENMFMKCFALFKAFFIQ